MFYNRNTYRNIASGDGLTTFQVTVGQTDLMIHADRNLKKEATAIVSKYRKKIETYIDRFPDFASTLSPWTVTGPVPEIIQAMTTASEKADVGPMASVAGAVAEFTGKKLARLSDTVIVENGGDVFIQGTGPLTVGIYAGASPLSMKLGLKFNPEGNPFSICTSSGTIGHSLSLGTADAACIISDSAPLADAAATAVGNRVLSENHIQEAVNYGKTIEGVTGIVVIKGDKIGFWGDIEVVKLLKKA